MPSWCRKFPLALLGLALLCGPTPAWAASQDFTVVNESDRDIWEIYASPGHDEEWGPDRLGDHVLSPGEELLVDMSGFGDHCTFDVLITSGHAGSGPMQMSYDVDLCEVERLTFPRTSAEDFPQNFIVANQSSLEVWEIYASPDHDEEWGIDRLGGGTLSPGDELIVDMSGHGDHCIFDVLITSGRDGAGPKLTEHGVNLCEVERLTFPSASSQSAPQSFIVANESNLELWEIYASPDHDEEWGIDRLGNSTLSPGEEFLVDMSGFGDHCIFDVLITSGPSGSGPRQIDRDVNLCEIERIGFDPDPLEQEYIGSAFMITVDGALMTNHHVIDQCNEIHIPGYGTARVRAQSEENDLALLSVEVEGDLPPERVAVFRSQPAVRLGEPIVVYGFPLTQVMSRYGIVSDGLVASLSGHNGDIREYQISAPTHPGNSGGPLLDSSGHVIGVVSSRLDTDQAENVSYAVKWNVIQGFLESHHVEFIARPSESDLSVPDVVENARGYTLPVTCT